MFVTPTVDAKKVMKIKTCSEEENSYFSPHIIHSRIINSGSKKAKSKRNSKTNKNRGNLHILTIFFLLVSFNSNSDNYKQFQRMASLWGSYWHCLWADFCGWYDYWPQLVRSNSRLKIPDADINHKPSDLKRNECKNLINFIIIIISGKISRTIKILSSSSWILLLFRRNGNDVWFSFVLSPLLASMCTVYVQRVFAYIKWKE